VELAAGKAERRLCPRFRLLPIHGVEFWRRIPAPEAPVSVANLSGRGIGFIRGSVVGWPASGGEVEGDLKLGREVVPIRARIVHVSSALVGCAIEGDPPGLSAAIQEFFRLEIVAHSLVEVPSRLLQPEEAGTPRWFRGGTSCELYLVENAGRFASFHVSFYGHYIEGGEGRLARYGEIVDEEVQEKPSYKGSALVRQVVSLPPEIVSGAARFVENISQLSPEQRGALCAMIQGYGRKPGDTGG